MLMKVIAFLLALLLAVTALPPEAANREKRQMWGSGMWGNGMMGGMMGNRPPPPPPRGNMMGGGWGMNSGWRGGW
ncbi:unnamed protein product [Cylicocyclus nassatus]|uniref:Uncharacterized protein n=1 Tax=Cylicocyclus nassatus TaxID=53992 RepID=A0AA36MCT8_CYLNA|nr:unnamed protein product [Cylicocyclus nassatus]